MQFKPIPAENIKTARELCEPVCIPMFVGKDGTYGHHAMGLLFAVADSHFLVTCRDAVHDVVSRGAGLWIPDDSNYGKTVALTPKFHFSKSDMFDLAVMKLPEDFVGYFCEHRFARAIDTHSSFQPEGISCAMYGILATESETWNADVSKDEEKLKTTVFIGRSSTVETPDDYIDNDLHFLIGADNLICNSEEDGREIDAPKSFRGLSGTPVFAVNDNPFEPNWNAHDCKIIGIQSSVVSLHQQKRIVMKVMRFEGVFYIIRQLFPTVAETLDKLAPITQTKIARKLILPGDAV